MVSQDRVCVLTSGGLDSAFALHQVAADGDLVFPTYVRSGFVWEVAEMYWLEKLLQTLPGECVEPLTVLDLPVADSYGGHWSLTGEDPPDHTTTDEAVYLPGRNILLLAKAGVFAAERECRQVVIGPLAANPFPDTSREFFAAMGAALTRGMGLLHTLEIVAPLVGLTKEDVIERAGECRLDLTFSCLAPDSDHRHCGRCNKCAERRRAFVGARVPDPTDYAQEPVLSGSR